MLFEPPHRRDIISLLNNVNNNIIIIHIIITVIQVYHIKIGEYPLLCTQHDSPVRSANKRVSSLQSLGIFSRHPEVS